MQVHLGCANGTNVGAVRGVSSGCRVGVGVVGFVQQSIIHYKVHNIHIYCLYLPLWILWNIGVPVLGRWSTYTSYQSESCTVNTSLFRTKVIVPFIGKNIKKYKTIYKKILIRWAGMHHLGCILCIIIKCLFFYGVYLYRRVFIKSVK